MTTTNIGCSVCGEVHGQLIVHSRCHPDSPTWVSLNQDHGVAEIRCATCDALVCALDALLRTK